MLKKVNSKHLVNILTIVTVLALTLLPVFVVYAQAPSEIFGGASGVSKLPNQFEKQTSISDLINRILKILLSIVGFVALIFLVWGGFKYMTASGDEEKVKSAKGTIINALIGLVIVILAYALVAIVYNVIKGGELPSGV